MNVTRRFRLNSHVKLRDTKNCFKIYTIAIYRIRKRSKIKALKFIRLQQNKISNRNEKKIANDQFIVKRITSRKFLQPTENTLGIPCSNYNIFHADRINKFVTTHFKLLVQVQMHSQKGTSISFESF